LDELRGNEAGEVLVEPGEETRPTAVGLEAETVELVPEPGEAFGEPPLDLGFEAVQTVFALGHSVGIIGAVLSIVKLFSVRGLLAMLERMRSASGSARRAFVPAARTARRPALPGQPKETQRLKSAR